MAIRVYELSKKYGITNKELLDLLKEHGVILTSIAPVPQHAVELVEKILGGKAAGAKAPSQVAPAASKEKAPESLAKAEQPKAAPSVQPLAAKAPETKPSDLLTAQPLQPESRVQKPKPSTQPTPTAPREVQKVVHPTGAPGQQRPPFKPMSSVQKPAPRAPTPRAALPPVEELGPQPIEIAAMTVGDFAQKAHKPVSEVIMTLLKQGVAATKNQQINEKVVAQLAQTYELEVAQKSSEKPVEAMMKEMKAEGVWKERLPVVVVIGHVDHGKTTLLDFIRKTRVAAREKGGITQHLGAYEVTMPQGHCVFLDTPGHEAFSLLRARGIKVADIAVLVVAADDGVMPQTLEAIKRAKMANIPIIVAINKVDKATPAQIEQVKRQLAQHDLLPEDWGGQTICQPISAKTGQGVDALLDIIILQSQMMDLKANMSVPAAGYILESRMEKGRGPVATVICQHGVLKVGDTFRAGSITGKVSSLVDSYGNRVQEIGPSLPVQVAGFSDLPFVGDVFEVITPQEARKGVSGPTRAEPVYKKMQENEIPLIIKADNASSREALVNALSKLTSDHRAVSIVYAGVGDISEGDVILAADTGAIMYGFHVKLQPGVTPLVHKHNVDIKQFDIIYKLIEDVEALLEAGKPIKMQTKKIGEAIVLKVFDIKDLGVIAGAHVKSGRFIKDGKVIVWRGKHKVGEGTIKGLQRDRKSVKEVHTGFECAFLVDGFDTWEVDDRVECFQEVPAT